MRFPTELEEPPEIGDPYEEMKLQEEGSNMRVDEAVDAQTVLDDPAASYWLKNAVRSALERDLVDSVNDAEVLLAVLRRHLSVSTPFIG